MFDNIENVDDNKIFPSTVSLENDIEYSWQRYDVSHNNVTVEKGLNGTGVETCK